MEMIIKGLRNCKGALKIEQRVRGSTAASYHSYALSLILVLKKQLQAKLKVIYGAEGTVIEQNEMFEETL